MAQKIKVIIKRPDEKYGHVTGISRTLENLQKTVGGRAGTGMSEMYERKNSNEAYEFI